MNESRPLLAALWMVGAIAAFTSMAVAGRMVMTELDTFELMLYRSLIGLAIISAVIAVQRRPDALRTSRPGLHLIRNVSHFTGQNLWFYALTLIPLAPLFALEFTSPIWVMLLAMTFLGEKLTSTRLAALVLGFIGVLIVVRPGGGSDPFGLLIAALAAIGFAGSIVATKSLTRTDSVLTILFYLTLTQTVFGLVMTSWDFDVAWPSLAVWPAVVVVGLAGLAAHTCLTTALSLAPATIVVPIDFARLPVAALVGVALYAEPLDPLLFLGAALIFGGNYVNLLRESRAAS